jgi:5-methylcytosine-specific restriction enzyme subunit McrC
MRVVEAIERLPFSIPITELMDSQGTFSFLPEVRQKGYFDVDYRGNELVLVAGKYVGQLPLTDEVAVNVRPKIPLGNLARMIGIASQPIRCLDFFRRRYRVDGEATNSLLEAFARSLLATLSTLDQEGVWREYKQHRADLPSPRGRLDVGRYIAGSLSRARPTVVPCTYFQMDLDTVFNRTVKRAIMEVGSALEAANCQDRNLLRQLAYYCDLFDAVPLDSSMKLIDECRQLLATRHIPQLRAYYLDILDACLIILGRHGVEIIEPDGDRGLHSLVVNLEDAFELYVRAVLQRQLDVLDGNKEGKGSFFVDNALYETKPDLVVNIQGMTAAIGDAKYKTKVTEADRYQLVTHALAHNVRFAFFVVPSRDGTSGGEALGTIGRASGIRISQYRINLDAADMVQEESQLTDWLVGAVAPVRAHAAAQA